MRAHDGRPSTVSRESSRTPVNSRDSPPVSGHRAGPTPLFSVACRSCVVGTGCALSSHSEGRDEDDEEIDCRNSVHLSRGRGQRIRLDRDEEGRGRPSVCKERAPQDAVRSRLPRSLDDAGHVRGAGPRSRSRRPDAGGPLGWNGDQDPRAQGQGRPELHVPEPGQGREPDPGRGAPRHHRRRGRRGRHGGAASGERGHRARPARGRGHPHSALEAGRAPRRSGARGLPEGVRGDGGRLRRLPQRRVRVEPGLPRHHRDHRSHRDVPASAGGRGRSGRRAGPPQGPPRGHLHGRLGPSPEAMALGSIPVEPPVGAHTRGSRPGLLALRRTVPRHEPRPRPAAPEAGPPLSGHRRPHRERPRAGSPPALRSHPRRLPQGGDRSSCAAHRRRDRPGGGANAGGVAGDRRRSPGQGSEGAARRARGGCGPVLRAPG